VTANGPNMPRSSFVAAMGGLASLGQNMAGLANMGNVSHGERFRISI
jgi:hypothetical protein